MTLAVRFLLLLLSAYLMASVGTQAILHFGLSRGVASLVSLPFVAGWCLWIHHLVKGHGARLWPADPAGTGDAPGSRSPHPAAVPNPPNPLAWASGVLSRWPGRTRAHDKRQQDRVGISLFDGVDIHFKLAGLTPSTASALVANLSAGGARILLGSPLLVYSGQRISEGTLRLPHLGSVRFEGLIRWSQARQIGIEFTHLSASDRQLIDQFVFRRKQERTSDR